MNCEIEEKVLCFKRQLLEELGAFQGLSRNVEKYLQPITSTSQITYLNRSEAERDRRFKQIIPYILILCNDRILRYRRGSRGQEARLHGLFSVGIGGHISDVDGDYYDGMRRELDEETGIKTTNHTAVALINDDSTDVGFVHFGVVHIVRVPTDDVVSHCSSVVGPEFIPIKEAMGDALAYEAWSRLCLENLESLAESSSEI